MYTLYIKKRPGSKTKESEVLELESSSWNNDLLVKCNQSPRTFYVPIRREFEIEMQR